MVLVDRKTDWFQDEISLDIKKFAWNGTGINREIRDFVLTYFLISRLISSWNQSVFLSTSTINILLTDTLFPYAFPKFYVPAGTKGSFFIFLSSLLPAVSSILFFVTQLKKEEYASKRVIYF